MLLLSSPRVAPGLLSWPAWELLKSADTKVYAGDPGHPQLPALRAAEVDVQPLPAGIDRSLPARVADYLLGQASGDGVVVWLSAPDGDPGLEEALAHDLLARAGAGGGVPELEILPGSSDLPGARLIDLIRVMDRLRRECPWVQRQTHRSLVRYLVEEAYETVEALEAGDRTHLREELGDLLFQVVFHARLAEECEETAVDAAVPDTTVSDQAAGPGQTAGAAGTWSIDEVAADLTEKLIRRNPHVFGSRERAAGSTVAGSTAAGATTGESAKLAPDEIENVWDQLKGEEKRRTSVLEGIPPGLPALALADKLLERVRKADLRLPADVESLLDKGIEAAGAVTAVRIGDSLLGVVAAARTAGIDPEQALRDAIRRFRQQVRTVEGSDGPEGHHERETP